MNLEEGHRILAIKDRIVSNFTRENWIEVGLLTGFHDLINNHQRLLRSFHWGDEDYSDNVLNVVTGMASQNPDSLKVLETYLNSKFEDETYYVSARPKELGREVYGVVSRGAKDKGDLFICHASEDKESVVRQLAEILAKSEWH